MKRAAVYIRVSSEVQAERASPVAQETDCRDYVESQGYALAGVYRDIEKYRAGKKMVEPSGTRGDRPGLLKLLEDAYAGKFDVIVSWREDRLYRGYNPMLAVLNCINETGVDIELVKENFDKAMIGIKTGLANWELDARRDRTMMGVAARLKDDKPWSSTPPYGYCYVDSKLEIYEAEAQWVRKIFEWRAQGVVMREIRRRLINAAAPMRRNTKHYWGISEIQKRLN